MFNRVGIYQENRNSTTSEIYGGNAPNPLAQAEFSPHTIEPLSTCGLHARVFDHQPAMNDASHRSVAASGLSIEAPISSHSLFAKPETIAPNSYLWNQLTPRGQHQDQQFILEQPGLANWHELLQGLQGLLATAYFKATHLSFMVQQAFLDQASPDQTFLSAICDRLQAENAPASITFVLQDPGQLVSQVFKLDKQSQVNSSTEFSDFRQSASQPADIWQSTQGEQLLERVIDSTNSNNICALLRQIPAEKHASLGHWWQALEAAALELNIQSTSTQLWRQIQEFDRALCQQAAQLQWPENTNAQSICQHPYALSASLVDQNNQQQGGIYSIGAGQMVSILDVSRQAIDQGILPVSTPLIADNRNLNAVIELNQTGQRKSILNNLWINPQDRKAIAVHNAHQRHQQLVDVNPDIIYLNVKTKALLQIVDEKLCTTLAKLSPAPVLVTPAKAYDHLGRVPYQVIYQRLAQASQELAQNLCVMGGFVAAPSLLSGDPVHLVISGQADEALKRLSASLGFAANDLEKSVNDDPIQLDIQAGYQAASALMAGGANKNFLTYQASRHILEQAFTMAAAPEIQAQNQLQDMIHQQVASNIAANTAIIYSLTGTHQPTSQGLIEDLKQCLPTTSSGLVKLVESLERVERTLPRAPITERRSLAELELNTMVATLRQDPHKQFGTRNARDGLIDELISQCYQRWHKEADCFPEAQTYTEFYEKHYPTQWTGDGAQAGQKRYSGSRPSSTFTK